MVAADVMNARRVASVGLLFLTWGLSQAVLAQAPDKAADEPIEEIIVIGEKSTLELKHEFEVAEDNFYQMFNELNDDWQYDVICRNEMPTGSHIRRRICWPRYELELRTEEARSMLQKGAIDPAASASAMAMSKKLKDKIAALAEEDPRLLEALLEYYDKYQIYESESKKRCGAFIACGAAEDE